MTRNAHALIILVTLWLGVFCYFCSCSDYNEDLVLHEKKKIKLFHESANYKKKPKSTHVHFNFTDFDNEIFEIFKRNLFHLFDTKASGQIKNLFEEYSGILSSRSKDLEEILVNRLSELDYEMARALIEMGIRIVDDLEKELNNIIKNKSNDATLMLKTVFDTHIVSIGLFISYESLLTTAIESGNNKNFEIIFQEPIISTLANETLCKIIEKALDKGSNEIFQLIISKFIKSKRQILLSSALKISIRKDRFFVINLCAKELVLFNMLRIEDRYEILKMAAEFGCLMTTNHILKYLKYSEYISSRLNEPDSIFSIAKSLGFTEICAKYEKINSK